MRPFSRQWWQQERRAVQGRWYVWPLTMTMALYGLGGLAWSVYNAWWAGAAFTAAWTTALVFLFSPSKLGWDRRKALRRQER